MSKKNKSKKKKSFYELQKTIRRDWGDINPVTKVEKDKTKYSRKQKHRKNYQEDFCDDFI